MSDLKLELMELELKEIRKEKEIAQYHLSLSTQDNKVTDENGFEVVKSGSGYATIMPNGIRLSKSKCVAYKSVKIDENGIINSGKTTLPLTIDELVKFNNLLDTFPKSGNKERAIWCDEHFGKSFTYEVIIYNLYIGTFNNWINEPIVILGE